MRARFRTTCCSAQKAAFGAHQRYQNLKMRSSSGIAMLKPRDRRPVAHALERSHQRNQVILLSEAKLEVPEDQDLDQVLWEIDDKSRHSLRSGANGHKPVSGTGGADFLLSVSMHALPPPFRSSKTLSAPQATACSAQRRAAV